MLTLTDGTILAVEDYCIRQKYSGVNELSFSAPDDIQIINEQSIHETTQNQDYLVKVINGDDITCELDLDALRSTQTDYDASATPHDHLTAALASVGWRLIDNTGITTRRTITGALTPMELIEQVENTWNGVTALFDTAARSVTILCPADNQPQYAFLAEELNLRRLDIAGDSSHFCTRLRARGADGMTFAGINGGRDYVENHTYSSRIIYGTAISDERFTDKQSLLEYAQAALDANAVPAVSYECDVVDVAAIDSGYSFQKLQMHKAVWLLDRKFNTRVAHRIVEYCIYPNDASKNKVTLSTVIPSLQGSVKSLQTAIFDPNGAVRQRQTSAVENATRLITGASGGNIRFVYDADGKPIELLIMDADDIAAAQKVWRFNIGGFGFSGNGYNGTYATAITQDGHMVADFIDVGTLTAVLIKSQDGKSKWDLASGAMELYNTRISTSAQGATYKTADYTAADQTRLANILQRKITPTLSDYEKYDLDGSGKFGPTDIVQITQIISGAKAVDFTTYWALQLDPADGEGLLKIYRIFHDNLTGKETEHVVFSVGFANMQANTIEAGNGNFSGDVAAGGTVDASGYKVNGESVTFPTRKIIGYVVCCTGGSANQATCFIPAGVSGTFQCASDDWYCAFSFSGGTASKTGGTGTVNSVTALYNF